MNGVRLLLLSLFYASTFFVSACNRSKFDHSQGYFIYELSTKRVFYQDAYIKKSMGNHLKSLDVFNKLEPDSVGELFYLGTLDSLSIDHDGKLFETIRYKEKSFRGVMSDIEAGVFESISIAITPGPNDSVRVFADRFGISKDSLLEDGAFKPINAMLVTSRLTLKPRSLVEKKEILGHAFILNGPAIAAISSYCKGCLYAALPISIR